MSKLLKETTNQMKKTKEKKWFQNPTPWVKKCSWGLTLVGFSLLGGGFLANDYLKESESAKKNAIQNLTIESQSLVKYAALSLRGFNNVFSTDNEFEKLSNSEIHFSALIKALKEGGDFSDGKVPSLTGESVELLEKTETTWALSQQEVRKIIGLQGNLLTFNQTLNDLIKLDESWTNSIKELSVAIENSGGSHAKHLEVVKQMNVLGINLNKSLLKIKTDESFNFNGVKQIEIYKAYLNALIKGSSSYGIEPLDQAEVKEKLTNHVVILNKYINGLNYLNDKLDEMYKAKMSLNFLVKNSEKINNLLMDLMEANGDNQNKNWGMMLSGLGLLSLMLSVIWMMILHHEERNLLQKDLALYKEDKLQQESILKLLDEIGELAEGDLTIKATVSDSFTGAIADSINYTIAELRRVISNVIFTAQKVNQSAKSSSDFSNALTLSAINQSERLSKAGDAIAKMSMNMDDIAVETLEATNASKQTLKASEEGLSVVNQNMERMNVIRETIQETSKKIKVLGESSTAIGEVTGFIRDLTKQINILALNAMIKAAEAGEKGRGFAAVANEVQRLAVDSEEAAKRIDELVLMIQEDAKGAVSSMESTTKEVVEGAKLTDKVSDSLKNIQAEVSSLSVAIEEVTKKVESESETANDISLEMRLLNEITEKSVEDSKRVDNSVKDLIKVADELRHSVSNFKI